MTGCATNIGKQKKFRSVRDTIPLSGIKSSRLYLIVLVPVEVAVTVVVLQVWVGRVGGGGVTGMGLDVPIGSSTPAARALLVEGTLQIVVFGVNPPAGVAHP